MNECSGPSDSVSPNNYLHQTDIELLLKEAIETSATVSIMWLDLREN